MNEFLKYLGVIIALLGVVAFALYYYVFPNSNTCLILGGAALVIGLLAHIIINRFTK
ncbi:MAG: hypothetical protein J6V13_00405 [Paludibacteraceae bacterium]|nr:hypothetical protein [Paludibacteraceae bacterium]MBO7233442.1 hypothetical protein [Paludibacteraceae bacterium]MBO7258479.1 hypothetical protein [Paludibacteraceae bacterium]